MTIQHEEEQHTAAVGDVVKAGENFAEGGPAERPAGAGVVHGSVWKRAGATTAPRIVMPPSQTASART